jgi:UPF0716 protein FxsA
MILFIVLLLTVVPLVELYVLFQVGEKIGFLPTVGFTVLTAVLGSMLARAQAMRVWSDWTISLQELKSPTLSVLEGLLVLVGGVLLLTPGFITDALGFACLLPWTRRLLVKPLQAKVNLHLEKLRGSRSFVINTTRVRHSQQGDFVDVSSEPSEGERRQLH